MISLQNSAENVTVDQRQRALWFAVRQALIIILGAIEDYLGIERSIVPRHKRRREHVEQLQGERSQD